MYCYNFQGQTVTGKALEELLSVQFTPENGDRPNIRNVAIVITDGNSTDKAKLAYMQPIIHNSNIEV